MSSETIGRPKLYQALKSLLNSQNGPNSVHRFFATLPVRLAALDLPVRHQMIVTTNYDNTLEQAFVTAEVPYDLVVYMASGAPKGKFVHFPAGGGAEVISEPHRYQGLPITDELELRNTLIVKIHGAVDGHEGSFQWKENYVITEDHYIDYLTKETASNLVPAQLLEKLQTDHCLFLGYSMRDWHLRVFLKQNWPDLIGTESWTIEESPDRLEACFWGDAGKVRLLDAPLAEYVKTLDAHLSRRARSGS